jgi:hypothetical protein
VGICAGLSGFLIRNTVAVIQDLRDKSAEALFDRGDRAMAGLVYVVVGSAFAALSAAAVCVLSPRTTGSGVCGRSILCF